jgi:hypothetical protein
LSRLTQEKILVVASGHKFFSIIKECDSITGLVVMILFGPVVMSYWLILVSLQPAMNKLL